MKKNIFLILIGLFGFAFTANAQCCSSKKSSKSCCTQKTSLSNDEASADGEAVVKISKLKKGKSKTETFTVYGNCGMCEKTIEEALKDTKGVSVADWNKDTHIMTVTFKPNLITLDKIKTIIADVGYDSDTHRASDEVYAGLHGCCQYERPAH